MAESSPSQNNVRLTSIRKARSLFGMASGATLTRSFVRRHLWIWPVLAIVVLGGFGALIRARIESGLKMQLAGDLQALLGADVTALELWLRSQENTAQAVANDPEIRAAIVELAAFAAGGNTSTGELLQAPALQPLKKALNAELTAHKYFGYAVLDPHDVVLASSSESVVGAKLSPAHENFVATVMKGTPLVTRPFPSIAMTEDEWGDQSVGVPTMFAAAPVLNDDDRPVAVLALRIRTEQDFTKILNVASPGTTGETYAFDETGLFLSRSRFEEELKRIGLQVDSPKSRSVLAVEIRDPGGDLTKGYQATTRRQDQPLTRMAASAVAGESGVDVEGYRDYRGVDTIGAWAWLPQYGFGVATEMNKDEAFAPIDVLRHAFWMLFALLALTGLALLGLTIFAGRLDTRMREAVIAAGQLGQYALEDKIGEGGMGAVYRARHAMLRRPTAVKLLEPSKTTEVAIARFEREVQLTSQLNHPNTITIYDYGRTAEGVFYYAMEYLEGYSLQALVDQFGPQGDGRVIAILMQVCGSLHEAHSLGLMHRDIKPANIVLTRRSGVGDFAKLLDFGLIKAEDSRAQTMLTATDTITGTPLYMSPENIQNPDRVDSRSDLYSLGAVGYFLLTGRSVFDAGTVLEIIRHHVETAPVPPSEISKAPISKELEQLILACLSKNPDDRPATALQIAEALDRIAPEQTWSATDAEAWWNAHYGSGGKPELAATQTQGVNLSATVQYSSKPPVS